MDSDLFKKIAKKYPFLTLCEYAGQKYIGIIQNSNEAITTLYDFGNINDIDQKKLFIELANVWWWESNRSIPINIFLKAEWDPFKVYLKTFVNKDLEIVHGPVCSLVDMARKKSKRKSITLVRRVD